MRPLLISLLASCAAACALPVADDAALVAQEAPLVAGRIGRVGSLPRCEPRGEEVQPGRPSCPECRVFDVDGGSFLVQFPATIAAPIYLGEPQRSPSGVLVWSGEPASEPGLVTRVVNYGVPRTGVLRVPAPIAPSPPVLYLLGPGCYSQLSVVDDPLWPSPAGEPDPSAE